MTTVALERIWYAGGPGAWALQPLAFAFGALLRARRALYRCGVLGTARVGKPVVVIGNITAGGTGKSPLAIALAGRLRDAGHRPAIVCRSWRGSAAAAARVRAHDDPRVHGDEAVMIATRADVPVWAGPDRVATALAAASTSDCDLILADDGLQHYALGRDLEIAVVDAARGLGNGRLMPAGPLREPATRLASVDALVLNGDGPPPTAVSVPVFRMHLAGARLVNLADPRRDCTPASLRGLRVAAVAGIGHPDRFFAALAALGLDPARHAFPDHHPFTASELASIDAQAIVMTEKVAIKCRAFAEPNWWYLPVDAIVPDELVRFVLARLAQLADRGPAAGD